MSFRLLLAAGLVVLPAASALAQSVRDTHEEIWMPAGKTVKLFRPIARDDCRPAARHHQAGKTSLPHGLADPADRCRTALAKRAAAAAGQAN